MAAKQGFLMYYSKGDAIGTRVSVRYRRSGRLSEVVVKRGSTVSLHFAFLQNYYIKNSQTAGLDAREPSQRRNRPNRTACSGRSTSTLSRLSDPPF